MDGRAGGLIERREASRPPVFPMNRNQRLRGLKKFAARRALRVAARGISEGFGLVHARRARRGGVNQPHERYGRLGFRN